MSDYRLYLLAGDGHISGVRDFRCRDDATAIREGELFRRSSAAELWSSKRRLKVYRHDPAGRESLSSFTLGWP